MFRRGTMMTLALLCVGVGLTPAPAARGADAAWKRIAGKHRPTSRARLVRQMKRDGVKHPERLLKHRYLLRAEIRNAGGGSALHSEVVVRFRSRPAVALAKAWNAGGPQPGRAQLGAWDSCHKRRGAVGRTCPRKYNGKGFVDVTSAFTGRNMLFVHDPKRKGRGYTILWFAADRSQEFLWYYVVTKTGWPSYGFGRLSVNKYLAPADEPPARLPGAPPDPGVRPTPRPTPTPPVTRPTPTPTPRPGPAMWTNIATQPQPLSRQELARKMRADGVRYPAYLLRHKYLVRIALRNAGGGSRSRSELQLRFLSQPAKALGKAWADQPGLRRGQLGAEDRCRPLPAGQGGPEGKRCPVQFNGLGWRNVISAFSSVRMRAVVDPNNNGQGNMLLWLAFDHSQTGLSYRFVRRATLPSFGQGDVRIRLYERGGDDGSPSPGVDPSPGPTPRPRAPGAGWTALGGAHQAIGRAALAQRMRQDGVTHPAYLLRFKYLVRLSITDAGGSHSRRSEVVVRFPSKAKAALGVAWSDHRRRWGAQVGPLSRCRRLPQPRNPYGSGGGWHRQPQGHVCPVQYNGLGWRNLIQAFSERQIMLVTAPWRAGRGNQLLWLGFDRAQDAMAYRAAVAAGHGHHGGIRARIQVQKYVVGPGAGGLQRTPPPTWHRLPGAPPDDGSPDAGSGWQSRSGQHLRVPRNTLYWTIRRDGFSNPWYLLRHHYLVRVELTSKDTRAETVLRFQGRPSQAVGQGRAASRSGTQVGSPARCRRSGRPGYCPLHFANIGWRNLISGLTGAKVYFVTDPGGYGRTATTTLWLAFDQPQRSVQWKRAGAATGHAQIRIQRYRW